MFVGRIEIMLDSIEDKLKIESKSMTSGWTRWKLLSNVKKKSFASKPYNYFAPFFKTHLELNDFIME